MPSGFNLTSEVADIVTAVLATGSPTNITVPAGVKSVVVKSVAAAASKIWARQSTSSGSAPANAATIATTADMVNVNAINTLDIPRLLQPNLALYTDTAQTVELWYYHASKTPDNDGSDSTTWSRSFLPTLLTTAAAT